MENHESPLQPRKRGTQEVVRRYLSFVLILFIIAFGTSLSIRANLGSSPISCPPYVLSLVPGAWSMGRYVMCMHIFFILAQILLLRRNYKKIQLLQILVSVLFGWYTDVTMWMTSYLQVPSTLAVSIAYPLRFIELLIGGGILALGIALEVRCDSLMLAGEGFPLAIAKVVKRDFGKVKICSDTALVCVGAIFMLIFFGQWHWDMIGVGTLVSMLYVGFMVRVLSPHIQWADYVFIPSSTRHQLALAKKAYTLTSQSHLHTVITISRQYGSGGHTIGEDLSKVLGYPLYDRNLIDITAKSLGYSPQKVAHEEQNISNQKLWQYIFADSSIPESMNPSQDDAIFVSQSRTIRELASEHDCIIVGRVADWILRDYPGVYRIFVTSDEETAVQKIMAKDGLSYEQAARKIEQVNRGRANHYWKYTNRRWLDASNYDLVINTSRMTTDQTVSVILTLLRSNKRSIHGGQAG